MKQVPTVSGRIAYQIGFEEIMELGGIGACDSCSEYSFDGFLIPVLNCYMCESCFMNWDQRSQRYPEDSSYDIHKDNYYRSLLGLKIRKVW